MYKTQEVIDQLTGNRIVQEVVSFMEQNFEDFPEVHRKFKHALAMILDEQCIQNMIEAIDRRVASTLFFSGVLGIKANWDHYINPMARTVLDVGFEAFLREEEALRLPEYRKAQAEIERFFGIHTVKDEIHTDIINYLSYLDTVGPKLAHYFGFALGDDILQRIVPGYYPDRVLTIQYGSMIDDYFGKHISSIL